MFAARTFFEDNLAAELMWQEYFAPVASGSLSPSLYTNTNTFFAATVGRGAVGLAPTLYTNSQTFFAPTVGATVTPSLFTNAQQFFAHQISGGVVPIFVGQGFVRNFAGGFAV